MPTELPRVLSVARAQALGLSRAAVRNEVERGRWRCPVRGILLTTSAGPTRDDWVLIGLELAGPRAAVSGWDAVRTRGLGTRLPPGDVLVLDREGRHRRIGEVRIRPTDRAYTSSPLPSEHPTLPFVPVVEPARAVVDAALQYRSLAPVRALVTSAVQKRVCTPDQLGVQFATTPRNGSAALRRALADVLDGARSIAEAEAVDALTRARVPTFEVNVDLVTVDGVITATVDLLWRALRAVIEIDSREFHFAEEDWQATMARHNLLSRYSYAVTHYAPSAVRRGRAAWGREVEGWLQARCDELDVPYVRGHGPLRFGGGGPPPVVLPSLG